MSNIKKADFMERAPYRAAQQMRHLRIIAKWKILVCGLLPFIVSCADSPSATTKNSSTKIDPTKVIGVAAPALFAMRITVFTYRHPDARGWPSRDADQEYVRFLQDRGIDVGFMRDPDSDLFAAMVNASNVDAVAAADQAAATGGIQKPPMVPSHGDGG